MKSVLPMNYLQRGDFNCTSKVFICGVSCFDAFNRIYGYDRFLIKSVPVDQLSIHDFYLVPTDPDRENGSHY